MESGKSKLAEAVQKEALTRPVVAGRSQDPRQVELNRELDLDLIKQAREDLAKGTISIEEFDQLTGLH